MTNSETLGAATKLGSGDERRVEPREAVSGNLWMVDHQGNTVLKCQCLESSSSGIRLRVPLGYGIADGQRYELRSHLPGRESTGGFGIVGSRWATVVRTQVRLGDEDDHIDVGLLLDATDRTSLTLTSAANWV